MPASSDCFYSHFCLAFSNRPIGYIFAPPLTSGLVTTFFGLLQAILGQRDLTFADSQTGIPSFRMTL